MALNKKKKLIEEKEEELKIQKFNLERIASGCVGDEREEVFVAQVVDPGPGCFGVGNHILTVFVVEVTVAFLFHSFDICILFYFLTFQSVCGRRRLRPPCRQPTAG